MSLTQECYMEKQRIKLLITNAIHEAMEKAGLNITSLAEKVNLKPQHVKDILDGEEEINLSSMALLGLGCGIRFEFVCVADNDQSKVIVCPPNIIK